VGEVDEFYGRLKREGASKGLMIELQFMFADWFYLHIKEWDKAFVAFLKSKNVPPSDILAKVVNTLAK
jgi:hemerythrin